MNNRFHNPSNNPANQNRQTSAGRAQSNRSQADSADRLTPNISAEKEQELLNAASQRLGQSPDRLKQALQNGEVKSMLKNMSPQQAQKVESILNDPAAAQKLLSTPQAQMLLKRFMGGK